MWLLLDGTTSNVVVTIYCDYCASKGYRSFTPNASSSNVLEGVFSNESLYLAYPREDSSSRVMQDTLTLGGYTVKNQTFCAWLHCVR